VGGDGAVRVYDARTGQQALALTATAGLTTAAFSPDGARIAATGGNEVVRVYDARSGQEILALGAQDGRHAPVFSPDGARIATSCDGVVRLWTAPTDVAAWQAERRQAQALSLPAWHRARADESERAGEWYAAAFHLGQLIEAEPTSGRHHFRRGWALAQLGRTAEADKELERALALKDGLTELNQANIHAMLGRWDMASKLYAQATEAPNPASWVYSRRALLCLHLGDRAGYATACSAVVQRFGKSQNPNDANSAAWTCALGPGSLPELQPAVEVARRAVGADPKNWAVRNTLGAILYRAGHDAEAVKELNESIKLNRAGGTAIDFLFLAMAHHRLGKPDAARSWFEKATQAHAKKPPATWTDRLEWQLLHREAEALLKEPPPNPKK
jgi:tetratricopeptide (TPR) repeat protein